MSESYTTCPCQCCANRREAEAVWGDWGNFCQSLNCAAGAGSFQNGVSFTRKRVFLIGDEIVLDHWRLGWLWARYENFNPDMRRGGKFQHHRYDRQALGLRVLYVASLNVPIGKWRAYVDAVSGIDHDEEWEAVADRGTKLPQKVAEELFPELAKHFVWEA